MSMNIGTHLEHQDIHIKSFYVLYYPKSSLILKIDVTNYSKFYIVEQGMMLVQSHKWLTFHGRRVYYERKPERQ